jgi:hypothetical protein
MILCTKIAPKMITSFIYNTMYFNFVFSDISNSHEEIKRQKLRLNIVVD